MKNHHKIIAIAGLVACGSAIAAVEVGVTGNVVAAATVSTPSSLNLGTVLAGATSNIAATWDSTSKNCIAAPTGHVASGATPVLGSFNIVSDSTTESTISIDSTTGLQTTDINSPTTATTVLYKFDSTQSTCVAFTDLSDGWGSQTIYVGGTLKGGLAGDEIDGTITISISY